MNNAAGFGFSGVDKNGNFSWDLLSNLNIWKIEVSVSCLWMTLPLWIKETVCCECGVRGRSLLVSEKKSLSGNPGSSSLWNTLYLRTFFLIYIYIYIFYGTYFLGSINGSSSKNDTRKACQRARKIFLLFTLLLYQLESTDVIFSWWRSPFRKHTD